jgi:pyrophosphatase PpaX
MAPKAVLFDLDGTISDSVPIILDSYDHAARTVLGKAADREQHRHWIGRPLVETFSNLYPGADIAQLVDVYDKFNLERTKSHMRAFDGMADVLRVLGEGGCKLGVVTAKRIHAAQLTLEVTGLAGLIPIAASASDTDEHKPSPAPLLAGAEFLGVPPAETAYVGDAITDMQAAQAAGMLAVAVTWGAATEAELLSSHPDVLVHTPGELLAALQ